MSENQNPATPETFIRLRKKAMAQGERDLVSRAGAKDPDELIRAYSEYRRLQEAKPAPKPDEGAAAAALKKDAPREPGETASEYDQRIKALLAEALGPIHKRFADEDAARERAAKEAEAKQQAAKEEAAREKAYKAEVAWFREAAGELGALTDDDKKFKRLLRAYEAEADEQPELYGPEVPEAKRRKNLEKLLAELKADAPGLFKAAEADKPAAKPDGAAGGGVKEAAKPDPKPPLKPATTGASGQPGDGAAPGAKIPPLDVTKLPASEYQKYLKDKAGYRKLWAAGQIEIKPRRA